MSKSVPASVIVPKITQTVFTEMSSIPYTVTCGIDGDDLLDNMCVVHKRFNEWLSFTEHHVTAYVRKTVRFIYGIGLQNTLDLANVEVEEAWQGIGNFKRFLAYFEAVAYRRGLTVYVESVLNPILSAYLDRLGYAHVSFGNYYKLYRQEPSNKETMHA